MNNKQIVLTLASLLQYVGKGISDNYADEYTYNYLKNDVGITNPDILASVDYSGNPALSEDSVIHIVNTAKRIALEHSTELSKNSKFNPLESVFNILNDNNDNTYYQPQMLDNRSDINFPVSGTFTLNNEFFIQAKHSLTHTLKQIDFDSPSENSIDFLLTALENLFSYVPCSDSDKDISLFDFVKLTAAFSCCIYQFAESKGVTNYNSLLLDEKNSFFSEKAFMMYSMDISGIQSFIYTINSDKALKTLRARSFYLEIFMENIIDEVLSRLELSRANLIYSGGGHCYIILPNTLDATETINDIESEVNQWLIQNFENKLYVAGGTAVCSADALHNRVNGSYAEIFSTMSKEISRKKLSRYSYSDILKLNTNREYNGLRECTVCKSTDETDADGRCDFCRNLVKISSDIMDLPFFSVVKSQNSGLKLPFGSSLIADSENSLKNRMKSDSTYIRSYGKNAAVKK